MRWLSIFLVCVLLALQYRLWWGEGSWANIVALEKQLEQQTEINSNLKARNAALAQEVHGLKNGFDAIEERARAELGMIQRGETFYLWLEEDTDTAIPQ